MTSPCKFIITNSTLDDTASAYTQLVDGENWIYSASLTASPQFTLEQNVSLTNSTYYNLSGEQYKLIPSTAASIASFAGSSAVSGIANVGGLMAASEGGKIQINSNNIGTAGAVQINGGTANACGGTVIGNNIPISATCSLVRTTSGATNGLAATSWLQFTGATPLKKNLNTSNTTVVTIAGLNNITISGPGTFQTSLVYPGTGTTQVQVDKTGQFTAFSWTGTGVNLSLTNVQEGSFVIIPSTSSFNVNNQGTFRVVRSLTNTFWIQNPNSVEETVTLGGNSDLQFYDVNSILPGDSLVLNGNLMGALNNGTYTVAQASASSLTITGIFSNTTSAVILNSNTDGLQSFDAKNAVFFKQIKTFANISTISNTLSDIILNDTQGNGTLNGKISDVNGFTFVALNKLAFDTRAVFGVDSYVAYKGLIKECTRVAYGDATNPTLYPGVKAAGSYIDIQPPLPRKIKVSVAVRLRTGVTLNTILTNIKSVVAGIINQNKIGTSISISDIVKAVGAIDGILAVSMISPAYSSSNDLIVVNPREKTICDASTDIGISLLSS